MALKWKNKDQLGRISELEKENEKLKSSVKELSLLNEIAITAGRTFDIEKLLNIIVQKTIEAINAEQASIQILEPSDKQNFNTLIRREAQSGTMPSYKVGNHIIGWVLKNKKPLLCENLASDDRFITSDEENREIQTILCVPIWLKAEIIGVFLVTNKKTRTPFSESDLRLLTIVASETAQLINSLNLQKEIIERQKLEQELDIAREMQQKLLPASNKQIKGLDVSSYFISANLVSGDYYDYFEFSENKFALVIADVSGHGPSAALMMTMLKGILHSNIYNFTAPDKILKHVNNTFSNIAPPETFVTMMVLIFNTDQNILYFSNAGHNPIIFYNADENKCESIILPGPALNLLINADYKTREIKLHKDDIIFVYTDGITEATNLSSEMYGLQRLIKIISDKHTMNAADVVEYIKKDLNNFSKQKSLDDDVAIIAVKVKN